jgi:hypothetical protein
LRWQAGIGTDAETLRGAPQHARVTDGVSRGRQQQQLRFARKLLDALQKASLNAVGQMLWVVECQTGCQLRGCHATRQLDQGKRIAACLVEDPSLHALV